MSNFLGSAPVAILGTYAYLADGDSGLQVIDITNPQSPQIVGNVDTPGWANSVAISGIHAYVADYWATHSISAVQVIDIMNPQSPRIVARVETLPGDVYSTYNSLTISGTYVYAAELSNGLHVIDITNPLSPETVARIYTGGSALSVAISGSYAYVAAGDMGLQLIDIINPKSPRMVARVDTPGFSTGVAISGNYAYVADNYICEVQGCYESGLQVIDISDPQHPQTVASVPGGAEGVTISGNYAYVKWKSGLHVIDITNPLDPRMIGGVNAPSNVRDVAVSGDHAYVAGGTSGLHILPLQCEDVTPVLLSSFTLTPRGQSVEIDWTTSRHETSAEFNLSASRGEKHWNVPITPLAGPDFVAFDRSADLLDGGDISYRLEYRASGEPWRVLAEQPIAFATSSTPTLLWNLYPNPMRTSLSIALLNPRGGHARLTIHDVTGRQVARVFEGWLRPGTALWKWSPRDTPRLNLPAGVYVARLQTDQGVQARKVLLVD